MHAELEFELAFQVASGGVLFIDESLGMKRTALTFGIALTLISSTGNVRAHGGCYGFWPFWPLVLGAGIAIASVASAQSHASPEYVYVPPAYPYAYSYSHAQPQHASTPAADQTPAASTTLSPPEQNQLSGWVPNSPGPGHWVPDPTPYSYHPGVANKFAPSVVAATTNIVTVTRLPGTVPVYIIAR